MAPKRTPKPIDARGDDDSGRSVPAALRKSLRPSQYSRQRIASKDLSVAAKHGRALTTGNGPLNTVHRA